MRVIAGLREVYGFPNVACSEFSGASASSAMDLRAVVMPSPCAAGIRPRNVDDPSAYDFRGALGLAFAFFPLLLLEDAGGAGTPAFCLGLENGWLPPPCPFLPLLAPPPFPLSLPEIPRKPTVARFSLGSGSFEGASGAARADGKPPPWFRAEFLFARLLGENSSPLPAPVCPVRYAL